MPKVCAMKHMILKDWAGWEVDQNENLQHLEMKPYSPVTSLEIMSYLVLALPGTTLAIKPHFP